MAKAKAVLNEQGETVGYAVDCPGCGHWHVFNSRVRADGSGPRWQFSGDLDQPTFNPSMLTWSPGPNGERRNVCHSFVTGGFIDFLGDTTAHALRGRHPLPEIE